MNGAGREPRLPAINVNNSRKDRWLCILSIGVLWTLIALPTVFYAIPFERDLDNVNSSALDNSILAVRVSYGMWHTSQILMHFTNTHALLVSVAAAASSRNNRLIPDVT